jgi:hypothetical protein
MRIGDENQSQVGRVNRRPIAVSGAYAISDVMLPHLGAATDVERMRTLFQKHLCSDTSAGCRIKACTVSRFRHRPGERCILQYTLCVHEPDSGIDRELWVTGAMYVDGRVKRRARRYRAAAPIRTRPDAYGLLAPVAFIPELEMLVQAFSVRPPPPQPRPADDRLAARTRAAAPGAVRDGATDHRSMGS